MRIVAKQMRPKPAVIARKRGRHRRSHSITLRRPSENDRAGQEDRMLQQMRHG